VITVNGQPRESSDGTLLSDVLLSLGIEPGARGVAVAVDGEVVPRASWESLELPEDANVEVLTAMQGG